MRIITLTVALFIALGSQAQTVPEPSTYTSTPDRELVLQWLHSPDPRLQAWAAHYILECRFTDLVPDLQVVLEKTTLAVLSEAGSFGRSRSTVAILDTIIQLGETVPAATLARIEKLGYNVQTEELVLLSRLLWDEAEPGIYAFYQPESSSRSDTTRVSAQMLAKQPPKKFAAELLSTIVVRGRIYVHDANSGMGGVGSGISSCCGGSGVGASDWPEIGRYAFQDPPHDQQGFPAKETLFLSAPDPIYLVRSVSRNYYANICGGFSPLDDAIRSHLIGTLLGENPASPFPEQPVSVDILFKSREAYRAEVQAFVDANIEKFNQIAAALTARDLLTEEERQAATLRIKLSLQDGRTQPAEDLPNIAFRPPVEWVSDF